MATIDRSPRRTPSSLAAAAFFSLLALALAGCGAAATANPKAALKDPCSLLTPAEISAAIGYYVAPGTLNEIGNSCLWRGQATASGAHLVIETGGTDAFKVSAAFYDARPLRGIGDEAAQSTLPGHPRDDGVATRTEAVVFRSGDIVVSISAPSVTPGAGVVLAKLILARLPW